MKMLIAERWDAVTPRERLAFMRYRYNKAPWESVPDYAERILKFDPKVTLEAGKAISAIFRAGYDGLVERGPVGVASSR